MNHFEAVETSGDNHVAGWVKTPDGVKLWVNVQGQGRPLVFIHGWTMSSLFWRRQAPLSKSLQIITIDLRGHGLSQSTLRGHSIPSYARDIHKVVTALGLTDIMLIGWSMGGSVVMDYWQQFNNDRLSSIGLVETGPCPMSAAPWNLHRYHGHKIEALREDLAKMTQDRKTFGKNFVNNMFLSRKAPSDALKWMTSEHMKVTDQTATTIYEDYIQRDYTSILPTLTLPALVVQGRSDQSCYGASTGRYVAGSLPDSRLVILDKSGHLPFYEEAEAFNDTVTQFLSDSN
jgi:pimeloyl-ACP methyl ester carboxylesterase